MILDDDILKTCTMINVDEHLFARRRFLMRTGPVIPFERTKVLFLQRLDFVQNTLQKAILCHISQIFSCLLYTSDAADEL